MAEQTRTVGRYELVGEIGRGGMATVYLARQIELGRQVALKELGAFGVRDPALADRFVRESRVAGSLSHPNVVHVYDFFEAEGAPYIAMEYLERGSLRPWVLGLTPPQVAGVLEGLLAGLAHAAARGVVHRDLKPENVLITGEGAVKIADFGIAKALDDVAGDQLRTVTGQTVGTPAYMAPEQAMAGEIGPWTDLYSLGVMAYEMLAGRLPFDASTPPMALLMRHVNEPVPPLREAAASGVDPRLAAWVERLLAKAPEERPSGPDAAWDELEEIVLDTCGPRWRRDARLLDPAEAAGAEPLSPAAREPGGVTGAPTRGPRTAATAIVAATVETPATAGRSGAGGDTAVTAAVALPDGFRAPPPRRRPWPFLLAGVVALAAAGVAVAAITRSSGGGKGASSATTAAARARPVPYRTAATAALTQLVRDNQSVSSRLQGLNPGAPSVSALARTDLALAQTDATRHLLGGLRPRTAEDRGLDRSARRVLTAEKRFLLAVATTLRRKASPAVLASLGRLSATLVARLTALNGIAPGASDSIQGTRRLKVWAAGPPPAGGGATGSGTSGASTPTPPQGGGSKGGSHGIGKPGGGITPLVLHLPGAVDATSSSGAPIPVAFGVSATEGSRTIPASCSPGSGSAFPVGATTVSCTASDGRGQTKTGSFTVTVSGPTEPPPPPTTPTTTGP